MPTFLPRADAQADDAVCAALIRSGSHSFYAASRLLPYDVRRAAIALYAFCRLSDDAVDGPHAARDAIAMLRARLDKVYAGVPEPEPVDRAFARIVALHRLPRALPDALIEGFEWDVEGRQYQTLSGLQDYAARVAGAVGAMMTVLMGVRDEAVLARACDLGVAMQLTNIARDVGEDARNGRVYLPLDWLEAAGIDPAGLIATARFDQRLCEPVERLLAIADQLYARSAGGIRGLPPRCRPAIHAARLIYREIGEQVRRAGHDSVNQRAVVHGRRKLALVASAFRHAAIAARGPALGPLPETRFLIDAVVRESRLPDAPCDALAPARARIGRRIDDGIGRVIEMLGDIERRNRAHYERLHRSGMVTPKR